MKADNNSKKIRLERTAELTASEKSGGFCLIRSRIQHAQSAHQVMFDMDRPQRLTCSASDHERDSYYREIWSLPLAPRFWQNYSGTVTVTLQVAHAVAALAPLRSRTPVRSGDPLTCRLCATRII